MKEKELLALRERIRKINEAIDEAVAGGASSASVSNGGASNSYSRYSLESLTKLKTKYERDYWCLVRGGRGRMSSPDFR